MTKRAVGIAVALLLMASAFLMVVDVAPETVGEPTRRLPTEPQDFKAESMNRRIKLTWSDPLDTGDSAKIGFTIFRGPDPYTLDDPQYVRANPGPYVYEHIDQGLVNGQFYYYGIKCVNEEGVGAMSDILSAKPVGPAGTPVNISVTYGSNVVHFTWEPPEDDGGDDIVGYRILKGPNEAQLNTIIDVPLSTSYDDADVINGVSYSYKLRASNSYEVNGTISRTFSATPRGKPGAPTNFILKGENRTVQLNWTYPSDDGGTGVMGYKVYRGLEEDVLVDYAYISSLTGYVDNNITNGRPYYYAVSAVNAEGEGEMTEIKSVTPLGVPDSPLNLTIRPGDTEAYLEWKPPVDNGGLEILGYNVYRTTQGKQMELRKAIGLELEFTDTNLTNGRIYYYQVKARNDKGVGFPSESIDVQPDFAPEAPSNFRVKEDVGFNKLIWSHAAMNIDYPVIEYRLFRGPSEADLSHLVTLNASFASYEDHDVEVGVEYYYMIVSYSAIGEGPTSPVIIGIPYSAPTLVSDLQADAQDEVVRLTWSEPEFSGGREIVSYRIYRGETRDKLAVIETVSGNIMMFNDTNVENGVTYYYSIMPVNEELEGDLSSLVEANPLGPPENPRNLVTSVIDDTILLEWEAPGSSGGRPVTGYVILRGESQLNLTVYATVEGDVLNFTDTDIEKGVNYFYAVLAQNNIGDGGHSSPETGIVYEKQGGEEGGTNMLPLIIAGIVAVLIVIGLVVFVVIMSKKKQKEEEEGKQEFEESEKEREHRLVLERRAQMSEFTDVALTTEEAHAHDHDEHNLTYDDLYGNISKDEPEETVESGELSSEEQNANGIQEEPAPPEFQAPEGEAPPEPQPAPPEQVVPPEEPQGEQAGEYIPPQNE